MTPVPSLFEAIGGTRTCRKLSKAFYARVEHDPVLRPLFPGTSLRCATEDLAAFLVQFLGGPSEDSQFRWHVSLQESHRRFRLDRRHRDAWMRNMTKALEEVEIEDPARVALQNFFERASTYLIGGKPGTQRLSHELGKRWTGQRNTDDAVAAIRQDQVDRAIELTESCPRVFLPGLLGLMIANGNPEMIRFVHRAIVADPSVIEERYGGRTLLHSAAAAGSLRTVELLLRHGADANVLDGGKHTPLYSVGNECASAESAEVVQALVRSGARVDAADGVTAATPLHMAARRGNAVVAKALLECGADRHLRDRRGDTPMDRALNCKKPHVAELLRTWRSKSKS